MGAVSGGEGRAGARQFQHATARGRPTLTAGRGPIDAQRLILVSSTMQYMPTLTMGQNASISDCTQPAEAASEAWQWGEAGAHGQAS